MTIVFPVRSYNAPSLGIMYLASVLREAQHKVFVVKAIRKEILRILSKEKDAVLAYSIMTYEANFFIALNKSVKKEFNGLSLFGGPHPTFFPEMIEEDGVDAVCLGEGEQAFVEMVNAIESGGNASDILNWWVKKDGYIYKNPLRPLLLDLDSLPFPDRTVFKDAYFSHYFIVSRGCLYNCSYCFNHAYRQLYGGGGAHVRRRSVENVIDELQVMKDRGYLRKSWITFVDSVFVCDMAWIRNFSEQYRKKINIPFSVNQRPDLITEEWLDCLKEANCFGIRVGIESGNPDIRRAVLGRNMSNDKIIQSCRLVRKKKLLLKTSSILGIPGGSLKDDYETLRLNIACQPTVTSPFLMEVYPRTNIHTMANALSLIEEDSYWDAANPSTLQKSLIKFKNKREKRQVENLHKFFSIAVRFPFLTPFIKFLIRLPLGSLYFSIYTLFSVYENYMRFVPCRSHLFSKKLLGKARQGIKDMVFFR